MFWEIQVNDTKKVEQILLMPLRLKQIYVVVCNIMCKTVHHTVKILWVAMKIFVGEGEK